MYFSPPDHPKCPGFGLGLRRIFRAKYPFFGVAVLGNEYPVLENEYRKNAGISRVKVPRLKGKVFEMIFQHQFSMVSLQLHHKIPQYMCLNHFYFCCRLINIYGKKNDPRSVPKEEHPFGALLFRFISVGIFFAVRFSQFGEKLQKKNCTF